MTKRPAARLLAGFAVILLLWCLAGIRRVDPDLEFNVLDGPIRGPFPMLLEGRWCVTLPGVISLHRYPRSVQEIPLPGAAQAMLPAGNGGRYGLNGWVAVRLTSEGWEAGHRSARGGGLDKVVLDAVRAVGARIDSSDYLGLGWKRFSREFEDKLRMELLERGLELSRIGLDALDHLTAGPGYEPEDPGTRLLVIGLDGADWAILDPLIEQGRLPNLGRLVGAGVRSKLLSISPMLSPVIWTTAATGVSPSRHGILDFLIETEEVGTRQPVTSAHRKVPTIWEILGDAGYATGTVAWWATWPATEVNGYLVSERVAYQLFDYRSDPDDASGKTWPPELYGDIRPGIILPEQVPWDRVLRFLSGERRMPAQFDEEENVLLKNFRTLLASGDTYVDTAINLGRRYRPRLDTVYLEGTDTVGHLFMRYRPPLLDGVEQRRFESFKGVVDSYYELADEYVGRLLEGREDDWTVMILSDHGFASDAARPRSADSTIGHGQAASWHRRFGALILSGRNIRAGVRLDEASIYDIAPTILALFNQPVPRSWPGKVLVDGIEPAFLERFPVRMRLDDPLRAGEDLLAPGDPTESALAEDALEKLKALGYISEDAQEVKSITLSNNSGVSMMAEGDYAGAEKCFREGLENHPEHPMLLANLGLALRFLNRDEEALEVLERAVAYPRARRMAGHHIAQICLELGDLECAERNLRMVLEIEPDADEVLTTLGLVLEKRGDLQGAGELYRRAAELDPDEALPRNSLGNIAKRTGQHSEAERWYLSAIEADPFFMGAYNNLALVYQDMGQLDKAIDLYARALEKDPDNGVVLNNLASLYYARGENSEAWNLWKQAVTVAPEYPSPYNNLAGIEIVRQRYEEAEALLRRAIELDPEYGDARINLAIVHRARNDIAGARTELTAALVDPASRTQALMQLGFLELMNGSFMEAAGFLEEARLEMGRSTQLLNALGEAYFHLGEPDLAVLAWEESLGIDPGQDRVREFLTAIAVGTE